MDESPKHCAEQKKPARQECLYEVQEQVNLIYGDRTQQSSIAVNDDREGAQGNFRGCGVVVEMLCILYWVLTHVSKHASRSTLKDFCILLYVN